MAEVLITFHCATTDADVIAEAIRAVSRAPLHIREERVHGRDFSDARTSEQVVGTLRRAAIELVADETTADGIVAAAGDARRRSPVRWRMTPVLSKGRIP